MSNDKMEEKPPRGDGTVCNLLSVKVKPSARSLVWHDLYGKNVWTVNAIDVEWVECEHVNRNDVTTGNTNTWVYKST